MELNMGWGLRLPKLKQERRITTPKRATRSAAGLDFCPEIANSGTE